MPVHRRVRLLLFIMLFTSLYSHHHNSFLFHYLDYNLLHLTIILLNFSIIYDTMTHPFNICNLQMLDVVILDSLCNDLYIFHWYQINILFYRHREYLLYVIHLKHSIIYWIFIMVATFIASSHHICGSRLSIASVL